MLPLFIFVIPGVIAHALAKQGRLELAAPDQALPTLIAALLPGGVKGLVVAGMLAALMSSLSSMFNSCSTLVTWDIYTRISQMPSAVVVSPYHPAQDRDLVGEFSHSGCPWSAEAPRPRAASGP